MRYTPNWFGLHQLQKDRYGTATGARRVTGTVLELAARPLARPSRRVPHAKVIHIPGHRPTTSPSEHFTSIVAQAGRRTPARDMPLKRTRKGAS